MQAFLDFLNSPVPPWLWVLCAVLATVEIIAYLYCRRLRNRSLDCEAIGYALSQLEKIYFCGYDLKTIHLTQFFPRYRKAVDWGFCAPVAGLSMIALHDNHTARFVCAVAGEKRIRHCWVEFQYHKRWYVIDPCWCWPFFIPKRKYYRDNNPKILQACGYDEFWQYGVTQQFYEKLQNPHTSWLIWELMSVYTLYYDDHPSIFCNDIASVKLEPQHGEHISYGLFYYYPEIIFSRRIMHQMMQRPKRTRPKAHTMRQVRYYQKQVQDYFDKKFIEAHEEKLLRVEARLGQNNKKKAS